MAAPKSSSLPGLRGDDQKLALVTGASGVLGLATARALIDDDYRVIMVDLDQQKLAGQAEALGSAAIPVALDISSSEQIPVGRFCEPEEVAHVVSFLVSPFSGFITGEIIDINGGLHMD